MKKEGNIVLIGFMGTGKSAIGREISKKLGIPFIDTDQLIEEREGKSISEIFEAQGESYFRALESAVLTEIAEADDAQRAVIALGGGTPIQEVNHSPIRSLGCVIWLKTSLQETYDRVTKNSNRPLLQCDNPCEKIQSLMDDRYPIYEKVSDYAIKTADLSVSELASGIIDSVSYHFSSIDNS